MESMRAWRIYGGGHLKGRFSDLGLGASAGVVWRM